MSVEVLRQVMNRALDNLRTRVGERLALESDFFWSVPPGLSYVPSRIFVRAG
ncbi:hypothetical protein [Saccharopolyspora endophytica]|uniref:Uncharacterized protein n=1 Tax=Saccharopolyspora endophytica TaxID=543886 RepID=A0ABS5DH01_9PSEU|nr:hypothetical protein [Saccharopolyspora endophytica]MBQ0925565.1 hypothetical protein [Saccharopolyspora endophytica]